MPVFLLLETSRISMNAEDVVTLDVVTLDVATLDATS